MNEPEPGEIPDLDHGLPGDAEDPPVEDDDEEPLVNDYEAVQ